MRGFDASRKSLAKIENAWWRTQLDVNRSQRGQSENTGEIRVYWTQDSALGFKRAAFIELFKQISMQNIRAFFSK
jgi:hypothetical protein